MPLISVFAIIASAYAQNYDFYEAAKSHAPVVIFVHGGAWVGHDKQDYIALSQALASQGMCVAAVNYGLAPAVKHPQPVEDLEHAIKAVSTRQAKKCDFTKIFLVGHSAGAHMIAFWNTLYRNAHVKGLIGIEGIYDLPKLIKKWPTYKEQFIVAEFGDEAHWAKASPSRLKPLAKTPWLLMHSVSDELVDIEQTQDFAKHLREQKVLVTEVVLKDLSHFAALDSLERAKSKAGKALARFLH